MSMNGDSHRCTVIPNPVDCDHFRPAMTTTKPKAIKSGAKVVCVGRPRQIKGIHILAQAMPLVWQVNPQVEFTLVPAPMGKGGGSPRDAYTEILGDLLTDERVRVVAPVSREELPRLYTDATVCVVPSLWEGFGYVCAEAMACGVPVIASRVGGLAEIVKDRESGRLVEPGNATDLARAIVELLGDAQLCERLGLAARKRIVENFSSPIIAARMADCYREVLTTTSKR
jgi:glycosyltransferase involved in cell wall biosynthesis